MNRTENRGDSARKRQPTVQAFSPQKRSAHRWHSRAVSRDRNAGRPRVFAIRLDRLDHEIELIGAVDPPGHTAILARRQSFEEALRRGRRNSTFGW